MWNPFKRKYRVPADECINVVIAAMKRDKTTLGTDLWTWFEQRGVKREYNWEKHVNYLVFDSEHDYTMFLLRIV
jgi:hypothetical protein